MRHPVIRKHPLRTLFRHTGGATAVEFAVVATMFFTLFMGVIEYGLFMMTQVAIEGAVTQAGRAGSISTLGGLDRVTAVQNLVEEKTHGLINAGSVAVTTGVVETANGASGSGAGAAPDICEPAGADPFPCSPTRPCPPGTPFIPGGAPDAVCTGPASTSVGGPGDIVEIRVSYPWKVLFPILGQFFGNHGVVIIQSTTVVKNEY